MPQVSTPSAEALAALLDDAFYIVDANDQIVSYNVAFRGLFPRSMVRTVREARCRDVAFLPCHGNQCLREQCAARGMVWLDKINAVSQDANGQPEMLLLNVTAGPVTLPNGQPGTIIILRDVGETRTKARYQSAVQRELEQAARYEAVVREMERQRREHLAQFVAGVTHEANTPLGVANAAMASLVDRLESGELKKLEQSLGAGEELEELYLGVALIQRNLVRVDELIRKLRRNSVGHLVDTRDELDLALSIKEALKLWDFDSKHADIQLELIEQCVPGLRWEGYAGHLSQVLLELLSNVERHAYPDGKGGKVEVKVSSRDVTPPAYQLSERDFGKPHWQTTRHAASAPKFSISVRDFGKGVSPDILSRTFNDFFETENPKAGTGLLIAQHIVENIFGGTLECESQPGAGTTFVARFSHCPSYQG
jgi:signal transduction histidine kinase